MATRIVPRLVRGRLFFEICDVLFPTFAQAVCAWCAATAHRLDILDGSAP